MSEETIIEDVVPEEIEAIEEEAEQVETPAQEEKTEYQKEKERVQKRIDKLTWEKNEEKRRAYALEQEIERLKAPKQQKQAQAGAPDPNEFEAGKYDPDYIEALTDYKTKLAIDNYQESVKIQQRQEGVAKLQQVAREQYSDYDDVTEEFLAHPLSNIKEFNDLLMDTDNPIELAYYLGKNPDQLDKISEMTPAQAARYIGRLEAQIEQKPKPLESKKTSNAPKPVAPVGSAKPTTAVKDPNDMSMAEYAEWRKKK